MLIFAVSTSTLETQLMNRLGQCVLTCPGTACYSGLKGEEELKLGAAIRYFGDGWQSSKVLDGTRYWRIPVMDGEFVCEETTGLTKAAVGGGNLLIMGRDRVTTLESGRSRRRRHIRRAGRHHAVSRRDRPLRLEGGFEIQGAPRLHQRCLLPDAEGPRAERAHAGRRLGARDRH